MHSGELFTTGIFGTVMQKLSAGCWDMMLTQVVEVRVGNTFKYDYIDGTYRKLRNFHS